MIYGRSVHDACLKWLFAFEGGVRGVGIRG